LLEYGRHLPIICFPGPGTWLFCFRKF
jgi:hypothetical protein